MSGSRRAADVRQFVRPAAAARQQLSDGAEAAPATLRWGGRAGAGRGGRWGRAEEQGEER